VSSLLPADSSALVAIRDGNLKLRELLAAQPENRLVRDGDDPEIAAIRYDSRLVRPHDLFVAVNGFHTNGHRYVRQAVERGAVAVVVQEGELLADPGQWSDESHRLPVVAVPDSRRALGRLAAAFYGYPSRKLRVVGVTGTDGKTTTTFLINTLLEHAGYRTGLLGTVQFKVDQRSWANESRQTTPEAPEVQAMLAEMVNAGVDYAIVESTSHALALDRVTDCDYDVAVLTNVTSDHLDFHGTRDQYLQAKARLFQSLSTATDKGVPKVGILNADDPAAAFFRQVSPPNVITYGLTAEADIFARELRLAGSGTTGEICTPLGAVDFHLRMPGLFNVYNALAAAAVGISQGVGLDQIGAALQSAAGVPGRMESIDCGQPFAVIVDYAHTADSLQKVLEVVRPLATGRVLVVFGCAGERDKSKRPKMGRVAGELADFLFLTNEDPRLEDAQTIIEEIATGARAAGRREGIDYLKIEDRREAIRIAFERARAGDLVLLAGKGHESSIIVGTEKMPWDDRQAAREALLELGYK